MNHTLSEALISKDIGFALLLQFHAQGLLPLQGCQLDVASRTRADAPARFLQRALDPTCSYPPLTCVLLEMRRRRD